MMTQSKSKPKSFFFKALYLLAVLNRPAEKLAVE